MKERIIEFLRNENKSSAQFAEEIGVQPSGISHIISGRNKPSLDFVLKMLEKYSFLSTEWLLFGKGPMYRDQNYATLFDETEISGSPAGSGKPFMDEISMEKPVTDKSSSSGVTGKEPGNINSIVKIVWFYGDGTFREFSRMKD